MDAETYKVAVVQRYTNSPGDFTIAELPRLAMDDTQIEIAVHCAALNPIDYKRAEGLLAIVHPEKFPMKLGYDVAGTVTRVGTKAERFHQGDRVYGRVAQKDVGTIGEFVVTDESAVAPIPADVPFSVAAGVGLAGLTAKQALECAGLREDQTVFVTGGMGGVGMFGVMLAKHHFGAKEIITTVSSSKVERAREMGATQVIDYTENGLGEKDVADVALDTVGDTDISHVVRPGGSVVSVAMLPDGDSLDHFRDERVKLSRFAAVKLAMVKRVVNVAGWFLTRSFRAKNIHYKPLVMHPDGRDLETTFNPLLESGALKPAIANIYPFTIDGVQKAFTEAIDGHPAGKIIICVKD
ncbi:hypothetical protein IWW50_005951 [Coemansia erecta]|nr:hypothetical protein IWW50_005951 [Coemansia erecta]